MNATHFAITLLVTFSPFLAGCAHVAKPGSSRVLGEIKAERNISYKLGVPAKAYVGESMASRKIYFYQMGSEAYVADRDFTITGGALGTEVNAQGRAGTRYQVKAKIDFQGRPIDAIDVPGGTTRDYVYGITENGRFSGIVAGLTYALAPVVGINQYRIAPDSVTFTRDFSSRIVLENHPYENFEILYSGASAGSIRLVYREYTRNDLVRPGFTQELNYPADATQIRFKGMLIEVLAIHPDSIEFRIAEESQGSIPANLQAR